MADPVILIVDDDPVASRAIARDVRRQYARDYPVVRADSDAEALDAPLEIKLRGEQVAVALADYRMSQMNGIQFLEAATDPFPLARRVLLTTYANTDAAVLHHQAGRRGHRTRPRHLVPDRGEQAPGCPGTRFCSARATSAYGPRPATRRAECYLR